MVSSSFPSTSLTGSHSQQKGAEKTPDLLDLGQEPDFGRRHGVLLGKEELELEVSAWSRGKDEGQWRRRARSVADG